MWFSVVCTLIDNDKQVKMLCASLVRNKYSYITKRALCFSCFRLDYEYDIEYECEFRISNQ